MATGSTVGTTGVIVGMLVDCTSTTLRLIQLKMLVGLLTTGGVSALTSTTSHKT
jgi:hypothetical protein